MAQLQINASVGVMLVLFVVAYILLSNIALKKLSAHLVERDRRLEGREEAAAEIKEQLQESQNLLSEEMKRAQIQASEVFADFRQRAVDEQRTILGVAREKASNEIRQARDAVTEQMKNELIKIEAEIPKLARMVLDQILQNKSTRSPSAPSLRTEV